MTTSRTVAAALCSLIALCPWAPPVEGHDRAPAAGRPSPPPVVWSTFLGGSLAEKALTARLAPDGGIVLCGRTQSADFPVTPGGFDLTHAGDNDIFVCKLSADGDELLWGTFVGGDDYDVAEGLAIAPDGSVVVTGNTSSLDFPTTAGAYAEQHHGLRDIFVLRLSADGGALQWSSFVGGALIEDAVSVVLDAEGGPIILGHSNSVDYPTTPGALDVTANGGWDVVLTRLTPDGAAITWSTFLGGEGYDAGHAMILAPSGAPAIVGQSASSFFPTTPGAFGRLPGGLDDAFFALVSPDGASLEAATLLASSGVDGAYNLALTEGGYLICGSTDGADFPTTAGAFGDQSHGASDAFLLALSADAGSLLWSGRLGGSGPDLPRAVARDDLGGIVLAGTTHSTDFPVCGDPYDATFNGVIDLFIARVTADGSALTAATYVGGGQREDLYCLEPTPAGHLIGTGFSESADFPTTAGAYSEQIAGLIDVVVLAIDPLGLVTAVGDDLAPPGRLDPVVPNPANPSAAISFDLPAPATARLTIHDLRGRLVASLQDGPLPAGRHDRLWHGDDDRGQPAPSGVYLVRLTYDGETAVRTFSLVR